MTEQHHDESDDLPGKGESEDSTDAARSPESPSAELEWQSDVSDLDSRLQQLIDRGELGSDFFDRPTLQSVGRYRIRSVLSVRGQAVVFLASDPVLKRDVVLKFYPQALSETQRSRMVAEGSALVQIDSPCVAKCLGIEEFDSQPFLVLEYVPGQTLQEWVEEKGPLSPENATRYVRQICQGLMHIHRLGLMHRDVKPSNVMINGDQAVLIDFGLITRPANVAADDSSGTYAYKAPEQRSDRTRALDQRADLFGAGAVLHFALTGRSPLAQDRTDELKSSDKQREPVVKISPELAPKLSDLCQKCLSENPDARFESVSHLIAAIDQLAIGQNRRRLVFRAAIVVVLVTAVAAFACVLFVQMLGEGGNTGRATQVEPAKPEWLPSKSDRATLAKDFSITLRVDGEPLDATDDPQHILQLVAGKEVSLELRPAEDSYIGVYSLHCLPGSTKVNELRMLFPDSRPKINDPSNGLVRKGSHAKLTLKPGVSPTTEYILILGSNHEWDIQRFATDFNEKKNKSQLRLFSSFVSAWRDLTRIPEKSEFCEIYIPYYVSENHVPEEQ